MRVEGLSAGGADEVMDALADDASEVVRPAFGLTDYVLVGLVALSVSVCVFAAGWFFIVSSAQSKVGVLDLPAIVELEEMSLTLSMMNASVTDDDREKAFNRVKGFGPRLEVAIEQARQECGCILLTRNAMVGQSEFDQTQRVKELLGLGGLNAAELRERISRGIQAMPDGPTNRK